MALKQSSKCENCSKIVCFVYKQKAILCKTYLDKKLRQVNPQRYKESIARY